MKKEVKQIKGKNYYLLGINKEGQKVWLEQSSFDCGWYWGIGYVEVFNRSYSDIQEHTHFDSLFLKNNIYDSFKGYFNDITLEDKEIWQLLELMKTLYTYRNFSDMIHTKGSHITTNNCKDIISNDELYKDINERIIPTLLEEVYNLLGGC